MSMGVGDAPPVWCFALNEASLLAMPGRWEGMICAAVESARRNTRLRPVFVFDGDPELPLVRGLRRMGVEVRHRRVGFYDALRACRPDDPAYLRTAGGAFLRVELPCWLDEPHALYTDCDVFFRRHPELVVPELLACAPEFDANEVAEINTGVMMMNLRALRDSLPAFTSFISTRLRSFQTYDQDAYRQFYAGQVSQLPLTANWRPYWGPNPAAEIVHYHGPKPQWARRQLTSIHTPRVADLLHIFHRSVEGYAAFMPEWIAYAEAGLEAAGLDPAAATQPEAPCQT